MLYFTPQNLFILYLEFYVLTTFIDFFPPPPHPQPLVATSLFSVSMNLDHRKYEKDHIVFVFLCVVSLNIMVSSSLHVVANGRISLFL